MDLFNAIKKALENKNSAPVPDGYCPNCWGRQEYSGNLYETIRKEKIDLNNINQKKGWIQEYEARHLASIRLQKQEEDYVCERCSL